MKRRLEIMAWMLIGGVVSANGQSISSDVIASAGEHFDNGTTQLSWTLGEVMTETYSTGSNVLTQGFHQTHLTVTGITEQNELSLDVNIYPNPTAEWLNVALDGKHSDITASLYDVQGKLIMMETFVANQTSGRLNLGSLAMGQYVLRLVDKQGNLENSYQVIRSSN
ncbi:MAG: T9SS type A sorting domain-containing protein [Flavobacteriales bacterium]